MGTKLYNVDPNYTYELSSGNRWLAVGTFKCGNDFVSLYPFIE